MLRFSSIPDKVFSKILIEALEVPIDDLSDDIRENDIDAVYMYFDEEHVKSYGEGLNAIIIIKNELEKLLEAHKSKKLYMPTDHHFKLLFYLLNFYCDVYNDSVKDGAKDEEDIHRDKNNNLIKHLDINMIVTCFFWDTDFLLPKETAQKLLQDPDLRKEISEKVNLSKDAISASLNLKVDTSDLLLKECSEIDIVIEDIDWIETDEEI